MKRRAYPSDLSDEEWQRLEPMIPVNRGIGRPVKWSRRELVNGMLYVLRSGCQWRMLPHEYPPYGTVFYHFRQWRRTVLWERINTVLRERVRLKVGRNPTPSAAIIDSQSVKTTERGDVHGYDGHKHVNGRKRHVLVDTLGLLLKVVVHSAALLDTASGYLPVEGMDKILPTLKHVWAEAGYRRQFVEWVNANLGWTVEVVVHPSLYTYAPMDEPPAPIPTGFVVLPRRWVVERTFGWLGRYRRLSKDDEYLTTSSEALELRFAEPTDYPGAGCRRSASTPPWRARLIHWLTAPLVTPSATAISFCFQPACRSS